MFFRTRELNRIGVKYLMKIKALIICFCILISLTILPGSHSSWNENLGVGFQITIAEDFEPVQEKLPGGEQGEEDKEESDDLSKKNDLQEEKQDNKAGENNGQNKNILDTDYENNNSQAVEPRQGKKDLTHKEEPINKENEPVEMQIDIEEADTEVGIEGESDIIEGSMAELESQIEIRSKSEEETEPEPITWEPQNE